MLNQLLQSHGLKTVNETFTGAVGGSVIDGSAGARHRLRLHRQQSLALKLLAGKLSGSTHGLGHLTRTLLGGFLVVTAKLHLAEDAFSLHLLFQRLQRLVDIIVPDENLHASILLEAAEAARSVTSTS